MKKKNQTQSINMAQNSGVGGQEEEDSKNISVKSPNFQTLEE